MRPAADRSDARPPRRAAALLRALALAAASLAGACSFDTSGGPAGGNGGNGADAAQVTAPADARVADAGPPAPPDACVGKKCGDGDNGGGPGGGGPGPGGH